MDDLEDDLDADLEEAASFEDTGVLVEDASSVVSSTSMLKERKTKVF